MRSEREGVRMNWRRKEEKRRRRVKDGEKTDGGKKEKTTSMGLKLCKSFGAEYFGAKISEGHTIFLCKILEEDVYRNKNYRVAYGCQNSECQNFLLPNLTKKKFAGYGNLRVLKLAIAKLPEQSNRINKIQVRFKLSVEGERPFVGEFPHY